MAEPGPNPPLPAVDPAQAPLAGAGGLSLWLRLYEPLIVLSAVALGILYWIYKAPGALLLSVTLGLFVVPVTWLGHRHVRAGRVESAVFVLSLGLWVLSLATALLGPRLFSVAALISVGGVIIAVPYTGARANARAVVVSTAVCAVAAGLSLRTPLVSTEPMPEMMVSGLAAFYALAIMLLYALIAWQANKRLLGTVQVMRRANRALAESERDLERKVEERTADLMQSQRDLALARDEALAASRTKSAFLASVSHELRTPLNAVIGYTEMLQEDASDAGHDHYLPDLRKVLDSAQHLLRLINDVLDLSKVEADKVELFVEPIDVAALLRDVAVTVEPLLEKNGNRLLLPDLTAAGSMNSDVTRLRQILLNLLSNATKFTRNGTIRIDLRRATVDGHETVVFTVADTGIGMTDEQMEKIFDAFAQADTTTSRDYGGTGLGLAITRRLCRLLGGDISVRSKPGKGTEFEASLTAHLPDTPDTRKTAVADDLADAPRIEASRALILAVDDDPAALDLMQRYLMQDGYSVATAAGGEECLRLARELRPDVITLDVLMPEMDGWTVLSRLKSNPELAAIPVILVSVMDECQVGYTLGAAQFVHKPVDRKRLSALLRRYVAAEVGATILIVDDDPQARAMLHRTVERSGFSVLEAADGLEALERMAEAAPTLILLDLMMPRMDGFEFLARLRSRPQWRSVPVIIVTAKDLDAEEWRRLDNTAAAVLKKASYAHEELLAEIRRHISTETAAPGRSEGGAAGGG